MTTPPKPAMCTETSPEHVLLERLQQTVMDHERHGWGTQSGNEAGLRMVLHSDLDKATKERLCLAMDAWLYETGRAPTP